MKSEKPRKSAKPAKSENAEASASTSAMPSQGDAEIIENIADAAAGAQISSTDGHQIDADNMAAVRPEASDGNAPDVPAAPDASVSAPSSSDGSATDAREAQDAPGASIDPVDSDASAAPDSPDAAADAEAPVQVALNQDSPALKSQAPGEAVQTSSPTADVPPASSEQAPESLPAPEPSTAPVPSTALGGDAPSQSAGNSEEKSKSTKEILASARKRRSRLAKSVSESRAPHAPGEGEDNGSRPSRTPAETKRTVLKTLSDMKSELDAERLTSNDLRERLSAEASARIAAEEGKSAAEAELDRMARDSDRREFLLRELVREMDRLSKERDEAIAALSGARRALASACATCEILEKANEEKAKALRDGEVERDALRNEVGELSRSVDEAREMLNLVARDRDVLSATVKELSKEKADLSASKQALDELESALDQDKRG